MRTNNVIPIIFFLVNLVYGYKVLLFFPYPGKSHTILGESYVRYLINAGHNVTYVTPIPLKNPAPNLRQIDVSSNIERFALGMYAIFKKIPNQVFGKAINLQTFLDKEIDVTDVHLIYNGLHDNSEIAIKHEEVQKLLLDTSEEFDVVVVEWLYSELYSGVPSVFNCPYIWFSSMEPHPMVLRLIDEIPNPAYIPDHRSPKEFPLTFVERVSELWNLVKLYHVKWLLSGKEVRAYNEAYGPAFAKRGRALPSLDDVRYNSSMMLGNSHVSSGQAVRLPQNYIPIAGFHIQETVKQLPENLKKIMDNAPYGVIYFSLGSLMKGKTMPEEVKRAFIKTFGELKQVVIWKLEERLPNLPKNVHIVEWAPQQSILAHPNLVLFITHGGLLSTTEALHYKVPLIGIPLFGDQFINVNRAVSKGFGKLVELGYDTPEKLKTAIQEVLGNPRYREKVNEFSFVYRHRPVKPEVELVHWVEHVARTRGAPHLRSPALLVPWYQKLYLDFFILIVLVVCLIVNVVKRLLLKRSDRKKKSD